MLNREEIMKAAEDSIDEKTEGEAEKANLRRGNMYAACAGVALCVIMIIVECIACKQFDFGKIAIIFIISTVSELYSGFKTSSKKTIISGFVSAFLTIVCLIFYIGGLLV